MRKYQVIELFEILSDEFTNFIFSREATVQSMRLIMAEIEKYAAKNDLEFVCFQGSFVIFKKDDKT